MPFPSLQIGFLIICWIAALVTLVIFLESWFALTRRSRLAPLEGTGNAGVVTVLVALRGGGNAIRRTVDSVLDQSYPFVELVLLYCGEEREHSAVARELSASRSHPRVRSMPFPFRMDTPAERIRALDQAQSSIDGAWILVVDPDVVLERHAIGSALEFAEERDITALGLTPGVECRSFAQKLVAPSLEWLVRMMGVVDRGRERSGRVHPAAGFMLFHGDTHSVINRMNRMPGILNESGWTLWSYRVEGLRTFQGDGSGWIFREATPGALISWFESSAPPHPRRRLAAFLLGGAAIAMISVPGVVYGLRGPADTVVTHGILYLSAFSYSLMATSYFFYSRRLRAAAWFAPLWFVSHGWALLLVVRELCRWRPSAPDLTALGGRRSEVSTRK